VRVRARNAFGLSAFSTAHRFQQNPDDVLEDNSTVTNTCFVLQLQEKSQELLIRSLTTESGSCTVQILNLLGQLVLQQTLADVQNNALKLNCATLPSAMYIVRVNNSACTSSQRLMIRK